MESSEQPETRRRSPAEAFDELTAAVNRSAAEISDLWEFSRKVKDKLFKAAELHRIDGMLPVIDSMLQIHQVLFNRVSSQPLDSERGKKGEPDEGRDDTFIASLLETVEEELTRHGIEVVKPRSGAQFDVRLMECTRAVEKSSRKDKANTVARVNRCGFLCRLPSESAPRLIAKAQVEVFAK